MVFQEEAIREEKVSFLVSSVYHINIKFRNMCARGVTEKRNRHGLSLLKRTRGGAIHTVVSQSPHRAQCKRHCALEFVVGETTTIRLLIVAHRLPATTTLVLAALCMRLVATRLLLSIPERVCHRRGCMARRGIPTASLGHK